MKKIITRIVLLAGLLSLLGCNTMRGVGQDVEHAGDSIQDAAN
jgi:predicted small secreted protein